MKFISQIEKNMQNGNVGPDEAPIPWDEEHNTETQAMLNMSDTCKFINKKIRKSLQKERKNNEVN